MLKIAVCEDDPAQIAAQKSLLEEYLQKRPHLSGQLSFFASGAALLDAAEVRGGFDLYLLDIIMPGINGIQAGMRLRELGEGGEIIYLSISRDYAVDSYETAAFFYLLKPIAPDRLFAVLDAAVEKLGRRRTEHTIVHTPHGARRILLEQILYVERAGHVMRYYCTGEVVDSTSLRCAFRDAAAPLLADRRFCLCGASFVFNLQHMSGVSSQAALLDSGAAIPIPRRHASALKAAWGRYWLEGVQK